MKTLRVGIFLVSIIFFCHSTSGATTWYVKPEGTGDAPTIQAGIDSSTTGDTLLLANGTYTGDGNRDIDYGGRAIVVRSENGDPDLCVIDCEGSAGEPHRGFHFHSGEGPGSVLEGITIANGEEGLGGGMLCESASPTIVRCVFSSNTGYLGGGMYCDASNLTFESCTFNGNEAYQGAGANLETFSYPTFEGCEFSDNTAETLGGGLLSGWNSDVTLNDCTFSGNSVTNGSGGAIDVEVSGVTMTNCTLVENTASDWGGVLSLGSVSIAILTNCTVSRNSASNGGVAHIASTSSVTMDKTIVAFNLGGGTFGVPGTATLSCCNVAGNIGGDWTGCIIGQLNVNGNFSAGPQFCGLPDTGNYYLQSDSPCAPGNHPNGDPCGLIGARPVGCGTVSTKTKTWGAIKELYQD